MKTARNFLIAMLLFGLTTTFSYDSYALSFSNANSPQEPVKEEQSKTKKKYEWESEPETKTEESKEQKSKYQWEQEESKKDPKMMYFKEKYEVTFNKDFEVVWNAIKTALADKGCLIDRENYKQNDDGLFEGRIRSTVCVFYDGKDSADALLKRYSVKMPFIPGAIWANGRFQYRFTINELKDGTVVVNLKGELSGFESYITQTVHFWKTADGEVSTGYLETQMLNLITEIVERH